MAVSVVPASALTASQLATLDARIDAPEHASDRGGCMFWHRDGALARCYVGVLPETGRAIGIVHVSGPPSHVHPAWWLDSGYRGRGLGTQMIDALAAVLKAGGCTGVGRITIDTQQSRYDAASSSLARRFIAHFASAAGLR